MCTRCDEEVHAKSPCHDRKVCDGTHFTAVTISPENLGLTTISMLIHNYVVTFNLSAASSSYIIRL